MPSTSTVSLVVTDLDGTFWHTDDRIDDRVLAAVEALTAREIPLLIATGRRLASTRSPLARVGLRPPAVVLNGALGVDLKTGERFHLAPYSRAEAKDVLAAFQSVGLDPVVYVDNPDWDAFVSKQPSTNPGHVEMLGETARVDDLDRVIAEETVLGFSMIGVPHADGVAASDAIGDLAESHLDRSIDFGGYCSFTVAPHGQSKWDGVEAYCRCHDIDPRSVLSVADGPNDLELLSRSAVGLVPAVAHPAALELADHVIPAASEGGWSHVPDYLQLPDRP